ncbi:MAG: hypothetical protein KDK62_04500 [Chlamydiia bacterium]|nr:hypothetical protein [Chlamydiia bacterium]
MTSLDHLAESGIVSISEEGNKKYYKLKRERELLVVIGKLPLVAPPWSRILAVISEIKTLIPELEGSSESTQGVILRRGLSRIEPFLPQLISPMLSNEANFEHDWKGIVSFLRAISQGHFPQQWRVVSEFEGVVSQMFQELYQVDDCIDGIDTIQSEIESNPKQFKKSYKECYQLFLSFTKELEPKLKSFLDFPFHKIMDEPLSDIAHTYSKEKMPKLSKVLLSIKPGGHVDNTLQAVREFQNFAPALEDVRHFINTFKKRLQELYFVRTEAHLLTLPDKLYKRHQVIKLFEQGGN